MDARTDLLNCLQNYADHYESLNMNVFRSSLSNSMTDIKQQVIWKKMPRIFTHLINQALKGLKKEVLTAKEACQFCNRLAESIKSADITEPEPETETKYEPVNLNLIDKIVEKVGEIEASIEQIKLIVQQIKSV